MTDLLVDALRRSLEERFKAVMAARSYAPENVAAGRRYVDSYVLFIHQAEGLWQAAIHPPHGHATEEPAETPRQHEPH